MIGESRFIYPSLWGLHSSFPFCSLSALSLLAPFVIFHIICEITAAMHTLFKTYCGFSENAGEFIIYDQKYFLLLFFLNLWFHTWSQCLTAFLSLDALRTFQSVFGTFFQVLSRPSLLLASSHNVARTSAPLGDGHFTQGGCSMDQSHHPWRKPGHGPTRPHW